LKIRTSRRPRAALALAAAVAVGLSTWAALPAAAAELAVDDAVFTWGISNEANNRAFAPGTYNFMSAGKAPKTGGTDTISQAEWSATEGNVTIQKEQADGSYATASWAGLKTTPTGGAIANPSTGLFTDHRVAISRGEGTLQPTSDNADITWDGSFTVAFYSGMTQFYVSDPHLVVAGGVGTLTATLSGFGTSMEDPEIFEELPTREVTLATMSDVDVTDTGVLATPDYTGVEIAIPEGAAAPQVRTGVNWGSFPQSFVDYQMLTGQSSYWYSSGGSTDAFKKALPIAVSYTVEAPPVLTPVITTQPAASSVALGETATFTVAATSPAPLDYQWQFSSDGIGWTAIVGATSASHDVTGTSSAVGQYRVIVAATDETVTSDAAALAVSVPTPEVVVSKTQNVDPASETVTVTGSGFLPNGTATLGTRPPLSGRFTGVYVAFGKYADVWKPTENAATAARSNSDVKWAVSAADLATIGGAEAGAVEVEADGTFETTLILRKNYTGAPVTGNYGVYTYPGGGAKYAAFETYTPITFATPGVSIATQLVAASSAQGVPAVFAVTATGTGTLSYQWQSSTSGSPFTDIAGETSASYAAVGTTVGSATSYRVVVTDDNGSVTSSAAVHTITAVTPTVIVSKTSDIDPAGESVTVTGTGFFPNGTATNGTRPPLSGRFSGSYVAFGKFADVWKASAGAPTAARNTSDVKWAMPAADAASIGSPAVELNTDGTFEFSLFVRKDYTGAPATGNYGIYTYPGGGAAYDGFETYTPITFAAVVPSAPEKPTATADGTTVTVDWVAPADGGSEITGYTVELASGSGAVTSQTVSGATRTVSFPNLIRGENYTATVVATNAVGSSAASAVSAATTIPAAVPSTPAPPTATTVGTTSVSVSWTSPAANGSAITGFSIVVSTGGSVVSTTPVDAVTTSTTVTGLTRATDYSVTVAALNGVGTSQASTAATVRTLAEAPAEVGAPVATVAGSNSVNVAWSAPADGGSAVTGYTVSVLQAGSVVKTVSTATTSVLVDGLAAGTEYAFAVAATNASGTGAVSAASNPVTTFDVSGAPAAPTAVLSGATGIDITWAAPVATGGTAITGYTVVLSSNGFVVGSQTMPADTFTASFLGLVLGQAYTAQVSGSNSVGSSSASSPSVSVTIPPVAPSAPAAPQVSVSGTDITVTWVAAASGGSAITGYTVVLSSNGSIIRSIDVAGDSLATTFSGLDYSRSYSAAVVATNLIGSSTPSQTSSSVVTGGPTAVPARAVTSDELSEETRNGISVDPDSVQQGGTVVISGLGTGEWYFVTTFSDAVQLGWFRANEDGEIAVLLAGVVLGDHRLAVQDVDGGLVGWAPVTVTAAATAMPIADGGTVTGGASAGTTAPAKGSSTLPDTGLEIGGWAALSGVLLLGGLVLLRGRRGAPSRS
jgi:hypothetical protein